MSTASWTSVVTLTDVPSAELPAERLRSEGVSVEIRSDGAIMGQARILRSHRAEQSPAPSELPSIPMAMLGSGTGLLGTR